ncbi:MAG TPA: formylglycine-generating enzyme family protein [Microthrixaceae bacterium]|nr:formylglycine-generating enzyme family protein [Microthrixaceae bacterium]
MSKDDNHCCAPPSERESEPELDGRPNRVALQPGQGASTTSLGTFDGDLVPLAGGAFTMGSKPGEGYPDDGEEPAHPVEITPFSISALAVTNAQFAQFVAATGHVTLAESDNWSFVFGGLLPDDFPPTRAVVATPWWRQVFGASWQHPEGPQSDITARADHPVVHVTWLDAQAFCEWSGTRLPTEAEWEFAARGGLERRRFPWGDELEPDGNHRMNVFQGSFPNENTVEDGWAGTCPADAFEPNGHGLHNMTGNVWEWCSDWFARDAYTATSRVNPSGPAVGTHRIMRGGSYLCHHSYCTRYRVAARSSNTPDSCAGNIGFRVVGNSS